MRPDNRHAAGVRADAAPMRAPFTRRSFLKAGGALAACAFGMAATGGLYGCGARPSTKEADLRSAAEAGAGGAHLVTDSCGRDVALADDVARVSPSGPYAQVMLLQLAPEKLCGLSSSLSATQLRYLPNADRLAGLPIFGKLYGGKNADMSFEEIIKADPDAIIDAGERKDGIAADLDDVQQQTGLPVLFVQATLDIIAQAYRTLGGMLGADARAEKLAAWAEDALAYADERRAQVAADGMRVVYATGEYGLDVKQAGSAHNAVLAAVGVDDIGQVEGSGQGEVSIEQMLSWNPDAVILSPYSYYPDIYQDAVWQEATAVREGRVYEAPAEPYSWIDQPPGAQQLLGVLWLGNLLYPDLYDLDIVETARDYYSLFWQYDLTADEARALMTNSTFRS